jgi:cysteine synthase
MDKMQGIEQLIGNNPVIILDGNIHMICEWRNLTGTPKTRMVWHRANRLEAQQRIFRGYKLTDVSTGSEAAALAQFGAQRHYRAEIFLPKQAGETFAKYLERFGAKVKVIESKDWLVKGAEQARRLGEDSGGNFYFNQAEAIGDALLSYGKIGTELANHFEAHGEKPEALVSVVGSGGLLLGTSVGIKSRFPEIRIIAVEHEDAPYLQAALHNEEPTIKSHDFWGIGSEGSTIMKDALKDIVDSVYTITGKEINEHLERIPREYGISVDYPTASNLAAIKKYHLDENIATIWTGLGWRTFDRKIGEQNQDEK